MKILKSKLIIYLLLFPFALSSYAQMDCSDFFRFRTVSPPWEYDGLSKGAMCLTGKKYEFLVSLMKGKEYRISFFASPSFNNQINFKIIDKSTNTVVMDLPGSSVDERPWSCVLKDFFDEKTSQSVHPYFDFFPENTTNLQIIIDVKSIPQGETNDSIQKISGYKPPEQREKGCITVLILSKKAEQQGFK